LASKGASLVEKNKQGDTPLLKAARQGNAKCFKLLIDLLMQTENGKLRKDPTFTIKLNHLLKYQYIYRAE
jgi:ankyrin repeat protein